MIFQATHQQVLDGSKTQTRRVVKPGESALVRALTKPKLRFLFGKHDHYIINAKKDWKLRNPEDKIIAVFSAKEFTKWAVGQNYAVQPGRGKKSLGRTPPIKAIRWERLQEIVPEDVIAEGFYGWNKVWSRSLHQYVGEYQTADVVGFIVAWDSLHRKPHRWEDNSGVWVLDFGLIGKTSV